MRRSLSTTTSAPMAIDDGKQYVLMSDELISSLSLDDGNTKKEETWAALVELADGVNELPVYSMGNDNEDGLIVCLGIKDAFREFTNFLLSSSGPGLNVVGVPFKSKVLRLESGRAYLRLLR